MDTFATWFKSGPFMPHGTCYLWTPGLVGLHAGSDSLIFLAYMVIPATVFYIVRRRHDLPFNWIFILFGIFIVACGFTHFMGAWNIWHADYWLSGVIKFITAVASWATAILLIRLVPDLLAIPARRDLEQAHAQLAQAYDELEQFAYAVSHDLRAPLRSVEGYGRALEDFMANDLDPKARHYLQRMRTASQRMSGLIDDLLELSRHGREHMTWQGLDVSEIAAQAAEDALAALPGREVTIDIQPGMRATGDPGLVRVVFDNLLRNALKFSSGRADARIEVGADTAGSETVFHVEDNGVGFDMRYADKLFAVFQRLHPTADFPGNGVGLATVQRIVHRHGGRIWARSEEGAGSTFFFTLDASGG